MLSFPVLFRLAAGESPPQAIARFLEHCRACKEGSCTALAELDEKPRAACAAEASDAAIPESEAEAPSSSSDDGSSSSSSSSSS